MSSLLDPRGAKPSGAQSTGSTESSNTKVASASVMSVGAGASAAREDSLGRAEMAPAAANGVRGAGHPAPGLQLPVDPRAERLIDVEIAQKVLGFETRELVGAPDEDGVSHHVAWLMKSDDALLWEPLPRFSTDDRAAHLILAFVKGHGVKVDLVQTRGWWCVEIEGVEYPKARQKPMAICRAALGFVEG